jgi:F0F1-type ATP synthase membrane subunit b/b'
LTGIIEQLHLDGTFFIQLGIAFVLTVYLANTFFKPFLNLFEIRYKKTVEDRKTAALLVEQANSKMDEFSKTFDLRKKAVREAFENEINAAKKLESTLLAQSRDKAKQISKAANDKLTNEREVIKNQLLTHVDSLAGDLSKRLLAGD